MPARISDLAALSEETRGLALLSLYELVDGLEGFCEWLDLDLVDPDAIALFDIVHQTYVETWTKLGPVEFERVMKDHRRYLLS